MSRDDGFLVMDVSADIIRDPKWRLLQKHAPDRLGDAVIVYLATMGESWKAGRRVTVTSAWPTLLPLDDRVIEALQFVRLLDTKGLILLKTWRDWFETARKRRAKSRDRWNRYNETRHSRTDNDAVTARSQRGDDAVTASSVLPPVLPSDPPSKGLQGGMPLEGEMPFLRVVNPGKTA